MGAVAYPTAEFQPLFDDRTIASIGVRPTEPTPISRPATKSSTMTAQGARGSHFSLWLSCESRADVYASYVALAVGLAGLLAVLVLV